MRVAVPDTDDAEALPAIAKKSQIPVIADIHFQPRYVFAAIDAGCAAVRVNPGNIKKFDDKVGEIAKAAKDAGIPIRIGVNAGSLDKRLLAKYGKATPGGAGRVGAVGVLAVRGARLPRHQDLGQAQRPGRHGARLRAARRAVRLPAAPRRHRGRPGLPGHDQVRRRLRRAALPGHRRHDPRLPLGPAGRGGQGRQPDPRVAQPAPARPGDRQLPVLRPRAGRRLQARRRGDRRPRGHGGAAAGRRHGLRRQRPRRGPRGRPRGRLGQRQGPDLRQGRGRQDRARVADRRDPDRGGHAASPASRSTPGSRPARRSSASAEPPRIARRCSARRPPGSSTRATSGPSTGCSPPTRSPRACSPAGSRPLGTGAGVPRCAALGLRLRRRASRRSAWPAPT